MSVVELATTDSDGVFMFDGVQPGRWWIAPAISAGQVTTTSIGVCGPLAQSVTVSDDTVVHSRIRPGSQP